jgi:aldose 1-epimerase
MEVELRGETLSIRTTVTPTGDVAVPISFGYHPYFRLPEVPRAEWSIEVPVREQVLLDERNLPTGDRAPVEVEPGPLGSRTFDDVYSGVEDGARFVLGGAGRRIEVAFHEGYPIAVVYAPSDDDVVCFEPMTAPTNALVDGAPELSLVEPGARAVAAFSVTVRG